MNLRLDLPMCSFEQKEGHIIGYGVIKPTSAKIQTIVDMLKPKNEKNLHR